MQIDFKVCDSTLQIKNLQSLLNNSEPTPEDIALAMLLAILIFYENRPGKIKNLPGYFSHGTGCHNPTSEKSGKTLWGVWRLEVTIGHTSDSSLHITYEYFVGGYLKAVFKNKGVEWIITADIGGNSKKEEVFPTSITITGKNDKILMEELNAFLHEPLAKIVTVNDAPVLEKTA